MNDTAEELEFDSEEEVVQEDGQEVSQEVEEEAQQEADKLEPEEGESKVEFDERQQKVFNEAIAKKTAKLYEERQRAEQYQKELEELKQKLPKDERPELPPLPDPYDEKYEEKIREREKIIAEQIRYDERKAMESEYQLQQQQRQMYEAQQKAQEKEKAFIEQSKKLKVSEEDLGRAVQTVAQMGGIGKDASDYVLEDPLGPQIVVYLSQNPQEVEALASMPPTKAAVYIETNVKSRLSTKKESAPEPPEHLSGKGAAERERGPKGAKFE